MKQARAHAILKNPLRYARRDRTIMNNPVVIQGMGLAPLVIVATSLNNALILGTAVLLLLTPVRLLSALLLHPVHNRLYRAVGYCAISAVWYAIIYQLLSRLFGSSLLNLGVYLPLLAVEPLIIYRYARVPESSRNAVVKGLRITLGYLLILLLLAGVREWLSFGTLFGHPFGRGFLPLAALPAGGFILLGLLCAVWRACALRLLRFFEDEARALLSSKPNHPKGGRLL